MENEEKEIMNNENEKNILILCMSTLPYGLKENYYLYSEIKEDGEIEEFLFRGVSQLEPGTKYFISKLRKDNRNIDKIFIIESIEARGKKINIEGNIDEQYYKKKDDIIKYFSEEFIKLKETIPLKEPVNNEKAFSDEEKYSAVDFYKLRLEQFLKGLEEPEKGKKLCEKEIEYEKEIRHEEEKYYTNPESIKEVYGKREDIFEDICLEDDIFKTIKELCVKVEEIKKDFKGKINIFVDMQGGSRIYQSNINSVIKMLEKEDTEDSNINVQLEQAIACDFEKEKSDNKDKQQMVDATINFWMLDMVSGMKEFINEGRGDTLQKFWRKLPKKYPGEEKIIDSVVEISEAIQWCDPETFNNNLAALATAINNYNDYRDEEGNENKGPLFSTFVKDLENDYVKYGLLERKEKLDKPGLNTINQIKWCMSKGLYQQALTLLEARMPDDIVDNKIIHYGGNENFLISFINKYNKKDKSGKYDIAIPVYCNDKKGGFKNGKFVFIKYLFNGKGKFKNSEVNNVMKMIEISDKGRNIRKLLELYHELSDIRNHSNHAHKNADTKGTIELLENFINVYENLITKKRVRFNFVDEHNAWKKAYDNMNNGRIEANKQMEELCKKEEGARYTNFERDKTKEDKDKEYKELKDVLYYLWIIEGQGTDFDQYCKNRLTDNEKDKAEVPGYIMMKKIQAAALRKLRNIRILGNIILKKLLPIWDQFMLLANMLVIVGNI